MAGGCFISDLRGTLSKYLKKMGKTPAGSLGSLSITIVCLVADLRHMRTNGDTHDGFDTQHAMTSDFNVKISRSPKDTASTHSPRTQKPKRHSQHIRVFSAFFFF